MDLIAYRMNMMVQKNILSTKNSLIILSSLFLLTTTFIALNQVQKKQLIRSKAQTNCSVIYSMDSISNLARALSPSTTFCVMIPGSLYRTALVMAARIYIQQTGNSMIGEPIDTNLVSYNNIRGSFSYGPPYERKLVEFYHYYYINIPYSRIETRVTSATILGNPASDAERGTIQAEGNKIAVHLWGTYSHVVKPTAISNDANYVYVTFSVLGPSPTPSTSCSQCGYSDSVSSACSKPCSAGLNCTAYSVTCGSAKCWKRQCLAPLITKPPASKLQ